MERCFEKHSFQELNDIDIYILQKILFHFTNFRQSLNTESVFFDVGTNAGSFLKVLDIFAFSNVHCFEPHPILSAKTKEVYPHIVMNNYCLGSSNGFIDIYIPSMSVGLSSIVRRPVFDRLNQVITKLNVKCQTLDSYCEEHAIDQIDFIKIDVEGAEKTVFEGAKRLLQEKRIKAGVFEIGETLKDAGTSTDEVCALIESYGYVIEKHFSENDYVFSLPED
jgi:FkbM family methyltransferase